jgi:hypothetical protein
MKEEQQEDNSNNEEKSGWGIAAIACAERTIKEGRNK